MNFFLKSTLIGLIGFASLNTSHASVCGDLYQKALDSNERVKFLDFYNYKKQLEFFDGSHGTVIMNEVVLGIASPIVGLITAIQNSVSAPKRNYFKTMTAFFGSDSKKAEKALNKVYRLALDGDDDESGEKLKILKQLVSNAKAGDTTLCPPVGGLELSEKGKATIAPFKTPGEYLRSAHANGRGGDISAFFNDLSNFTYGLSARALDKDDLVKAVQDKF